MVEEWRKEVTTVDTGCTRLEYAGQEENQCISLPVFAVLHLHNRLSIRKTVQRGGSHHAILTPKNAEAPRRRSTGRVLLEAPKLSYGGGGVAKEGRL